MYNPIIVNHFSDSKNVGELSNPDMEIKVGNDVCDDKIIIHLAINDKNEVEDAKFLAYGCATSIATGSIFCDYGKGKTLDVIRITNKLTREKLLGELEPSQHHCLNILNDIFEQLTELGEVSND